MPSLNTAKDREYFAHRAAAERAMAERCRDEQIAAIHIELANRYEGAAKLPVDKARFSLEFS